MVKRNMCYLHDVRMGRPDVGVLVHDAAAEIKTREGDKARLVVAVCGPTTMVNAAQNAVIAAQKASNCGSVCLDFSGIDWYW